MKIRGKKENSRVRGGVMKGGRVGSPKMKGSEAMCCQK